jgi:hypothetical protein
MFSEAIEAEGELVFANAYRIEAGWQPLPERDEPALAQVQEPGVRQDVSGRGLIGASRGMARKSRSSACIGKMPRPRPLYCCSPNFRGRSQ